MPINNRFKLIGNRRIDLMSIKKTNLIFLPFIILVTLFGLIIHLFFALTVVTLVKYILSQVFVVFLPGLVCTKYIIGEREHSIVHWISLGYVFGYSINILEYIIIWSFNLQQYALPIVVSITILFLLLWFYYPLDIKFDNINQFDYSLLFLFLAYTMINILAYSGNNISPLTISGETSIIRDNQFWCSNAVALKQSFLPKAAYFSGTTLYYHYFSSMHIAFISQLTGISIFNLAFTMFSFGKCILLIGGLNYLIDRYKMGNISYLFYMLILFMTGWEKKSFVVFGAHLNYNPFGFDIGFAFGLWFTAFSLDIIDRSDIEWKDFLGIMLIWTVLCGLKGPIAILLILIPGLFCLIWLYQKKYKMAFGYGLSFIVIFLVINIFCVGIIRILNHTAEPIIPDVGNIRTIYEVISGTPYTTKYSNIIPAFVWYLYNSHPVLFLISVINLLSVLGTLLIKRINPKRYGKLIVSFIVAFLGAIVGIIYNAGGRSEMYFVMGSYIPCIVFNIEAYCLLLKLRCFSIRITDIVYKVSFIVISIIGIYCWIFNDYSNGMINVVYEGYMKINGGIEYADGNETFTMREAVACEWLRDNTPQNSIVQSNRIIKYPIRSYFVSMFSERIQYLEASELIYYSDLGIEEPNVESRETKRRSNLISMVYKGNIDALNQLRNEGVNYLIQDNLICDNKLEGLGLDSVYEENNVIIYCLD